MKKKCPSLKEDLSLVATRIRTKNVHSLISPPNFDGNHGLINESHLVSNQNPNMTLNVRDLIRIRDVKPRKSLSQKKLEEISLTTEKKELKKSSIIIDSLEKCRSIFDKIIEKDKKYGHLLKQIKEVYEKELEKKPTPTYEKIHISSISKDPKRIEESDHLSVLTKSSSKTKSQSFLKVAHPIKFPIRNMLKKDSGSTADTVHISPKGIIPELSLGSIQKSDFHDEFMSNYENFSESWRKLISNTGQPDKKDQK
ncbi:hypothetical protein SteCoe_35297 [Stentor coeruleus]|uniref:Uncharacterized protein n=1 Tax=Stentor coeruleus TaxID=5963 RepID=A0A1R2ASM6_9CILI|nr:hypothetical protein SteCoe_35297 [Stentor coeruleus]